MNILLKKLYYIGSVKSEKEVRQIGAHGEGIKKVFSDLARMGFFTLFYYQEIKL